MDEDDVLGEVDGVAEEAPDGILQQDWPACAAGMVADNSNTSNEAVNEADVMCFISVPFTRIEKNSKIIIVKDAL